MRFRESVCRIVFGGLFLVSAIIVAVLAESAYLFVAAVLLINALLCGVSGALNLVKIKRAVNTETSQIQADAVKQ